MFTCHKKKILKMVILHQNNIEGIDLNDSHYFCMETYQNQKKTMEKYEYDDWITEIDMDKLYPDNYSFKVRMMGFDPDGHSTNDNFKIWYNFYLYRSS